MTKKNQTKRALISSVISLLLCFSMLVGTTFAWFTDSVSSTNNKIVAGNLDIELYYQNDETLEKDPNNGWVEVDENTNIFKKDTLWEPGHTEVVKFKIVNAGTLALKYQLGVNVASETPSTNVAGEPFKLSDYIKYGIVDGEQDYTRETAIAAVDATATKLNVAYESGTKTLQPKAENSTAHEAIVTMVVYMPETVGNEANAKKGAATPSIQLGVNLVATQKDAEEDSFGDDYDAGANLPVVENAAELAGAMAEGKSVKLGGNITSSEPIIVPEGKSAVIDLAGFSISSEDTANTYAINNQGTLTIIDSSSNAATLSTTDAEITPVPGTINARGIYNGYDASGNGNHNHNAKLIIEGGVFNAMGEKGSAAVYNYGIVEINGGTFTSVGSYALNNQAGAKMTINNATVTGGMYNSGAEVIINGGDISGKRSGCHTVYCWNSDVTINGGNFYNYNSGNSTIMAAGTTEMIINGGTYGIKDGRVPGNGNTWTSCLTDTQNSAVITVNSGTFNGGFRVQAGTTMNINGGSFNDCYGSNYNIYGTAVVKGGAFTDDTAKKFATKYAAAGYDIGADGTVDIAIKNGADLQNAIDNAKNGDTIYFAADVESVDGVLITDKNITIDLNGKKFTVSEGASTNYRNFKINGTSVVTIKNGTLIADGEIASGAYGTVRTEGSANVTLEGLKLYSYRGYGLNVKACTGTNITVNNCEIYAQYSGGVEAAGGSIVLNNSKIQQTGLDSSAAWCSVAIGVNGGGSVTVNSGEYSAATIATDANAAVGTWVAYVMSSGGTLEINGGTFTSTVAATASAANACGLICADRAAVVNINGGTFNSNGAILDMRNNVGSLPNPIATINGGTFTADPRISGLYSSNLIKVAEGKIVVNNNGKYNVVEGVAVTNSEELSAAIASAPAGSSIYLAAGDYSVRFTNNTAFNVNNLTLIGMGQVNLSVSSSEAWYGRVQGSNVTFENIHFTSSVGATGKATYNNCTFDSWAICASSNKEETYFNYCTINGCLNSSTDFNSGDVYVKNCEIAKAEYSGSMTMNFENCQIGEMIIWNANTNLTNCVVTTLDCSNVTGATIIVDGVEQ